MVRVAVFTSVSVQWMPYILKSFRKQYPNIEFELLPSNYNTEIARWIQDGTADCGFLVLPTEANLDCWLLQRDQWKAIVPWDHPLAGREPFPPEALTQYPFILLEEGDDYEIQEVLDTLGVQPNVQYRVQQDQVILAGHQHHGGADAGPERIPGGGLLLRQALLPEHWHLRQGQAGHLPLHLPFCGARAAVGAGEVQRMSHTAAVDRAGIHYIYNRYPDFFDRAGRRGLLPEPEL